MLFVVRGGRPATRAELFPVKVETLYRYYGKLVGVRTGAYGVLDLWPPYVFAGQVRWP